MRPLVFVTLLALAVTLTGCLLSPDREDRSALSLRVVAQESTVKSPCGDPTDLLRGPTENLRAVARVLRLPKDADRDDVGEVIASVDLDIGEFDAATTSREMTGELRVPLGPAGSEWEIQVELLYDGPTGRDPLGDYFGNIRLDSGIEVLVQPFRILTDFGGGAHGGDISFRFGTLTNNPPVPLDPILYDPILNLMEFQYSVEDIEWNDDPEDVRTIEVEFEGGFGPSVIYARTQGLPDLLPGPVPIDLPTIVLDPRTPAPLALELNGRLEVRFEDRSTPRETATVRLQRLFIGCDQ